ncbi:hypothetical protein FN846DRAFT_922734 [Sphaerosporella brunnea]|uniref:Uncharacterized protein n=1 Tax=Sphaerosporella brunnea TaxID=1250544 RepID=A0A5J5EI64_9PEZI|nr:hypothetical protein FN846DRAFT_922734 [Sphaerosporella brunnea]
MPPQRIRPTKQERLQRRQNPLRRPSPVPSAPPVEGDGTDDTTNVNDDENAMLREQLADVRQLAKLATRVIEEQDRTIAELKAALEDEKTRRRALESQLQNCRFNLQFHQWWNEGPTVDGNDAAIGWGNVSWGNFGVLTSADADLESTYLPSVSGQSIDSPQESDSLCEMTVFWFKRSSPPWSSRLTRHESPALCTCASL